MAATTLFWLKVPAAQKGKDWSVPCMPWVAAASIFLNVFLLGSVDKQSYMRFLGWTAVAVVFYLLYGVHSTHDAEAQLSLDMPMKACEGMEFEKFMKHDEASSPWLQRITPLSIQSVKLAIDPR